MVAAPRGAHCHARRRSSGRCSGSWRSRCWRGRRWRSSGGRSSGGLGCGGGRCCRGPCASARGRRGGRRVEPRNRRCGGVTCGLRGRSASTGRASARWRSRALRRQRRDYGDAMNGFVVRAAIGGLTEVSSVDDDCGSASPARHAHLLAANLRVGNGVLRWATAAGYVHRSATRASRLGAQSRFEKSDKRPDVETINRLAPATAAFLLLSHSHRRRQALRSGSRRLRSARPARGPRASLTSERASGASSRSKERVPAPRSTLRGVPALRRDAAPARAENARWFALTAGENGRIRRGWVLVTAQRS
jgi:hypothetical protein